MKPKRNVSQKMEDFLAGKGFYIVLFLCVAVVGATAWVLFFTGGEQSGLPDSGQVLNPNPSASITEPADEDLYRPTIGDAKIDDPAEQTDEPSPSETPTDSDSETSLSPADEVLAQAGKIFIWPLSGEIILPYAVSELIYNKTMSDWRTHSGIDLAADLGASVMAVSAGTIESVYADELYGTTVVIHHGNEVRSIYSNLAKSPPVSVGDVVSAGDVIGTVGNTAIIETGIESHLHLEMSKDHATISPLEYLPTT